DVRLRSPPRRCSCDTTVCDPDCSQSAIKWAAKPVLRPGSDPAPPVICAPGRNSGAPHRWYPDIRKRSPSPVAEAARATTVYFFWIAECPAELGQEPCSDARVNQLHAAESLRHRNCLVVDRTSPLRNA